MRAEGGVSWDVVIDLGCCFVNRVSGEVDEDEELRITTTTVIVVVVKVVVVGALT